MQPYPPLGTLYAASWLRERGYEVGLFDAMLEPDESGWERGARRRRRPPEFAVLFEDNFNYLSKMCLLRMREAAFTMLAAARARGRDHDRLRQRRHRQRRSATSTAAPTGWSSARAR